MDAIDHYLERRSTPYGETAAPRDVWVDLPMTSDNDMRRALVRGKQKLTCYNNENQCKLFDLASDPNEDKPIVTGLTSCDPVRRTAWGTILVREEAGATGGLYEIIDPVHITTPIIVGMTL